MKEPESFYHYRSMVSAGDNRKFLIVSILVHFILIYLILAADLLPNPGAVRSFRQGGGGSPSIIGAGLVSGLPKGEEYYKPPVIPLQPAMKVPAEPPPAPPRPDDFQKTPPEKPKTPVKPPPAKPEPPVAPSTPPPAETKTATGGVRSGTGDGPAGQESQGGTGGGSGGGHGVSVGAGSGNPLFDSWYARQVEQRLGANWLKSRMGIQFTGRHRVVVQFEVAPDGKLQNTKIIETTGPEAFERSALRAVQASNPLPPPPSQYTMQKDRLLFTAIFEYPTN